MNAPDALQEAFRQVKEAHADALRVYELNKEYGAPGQSVAFDSGRVDGLKQALEILARLA